MKFATSSLKVIATPLLPITRPHKLSSFGVLATLLAFAAVVVGYLQLRRFRQTQDEEANRNSMDAFDLVDLQ